MDKSAARLEGFDVECRGCLWTDKSSLADCGFLGWENTNVLARQKVKKVK